MDALLCMWKPVLYAPRYTGARRGRITNPASGSFLPIGRGTRQFGQFFAECLDHVGAERRDGHIRIDRGDAGWLSGRRCGRWWQLIRSWSRARRGRFRLLRDRVAAVWIVAAGESRENHQCRWKQDGKQ